MSGHVSPSPAPEAPSSNPSNFLASITGAKVAVKLNSGVEYRGELQCVDGYMNIALEKAEEYVDGTLKNDYGDVFIRGNNVLYISAI
ncbi:U6 snRNA-associated Sm-like protein LSm6 [Lipomyces japonicus]|uniref:U6 snRNA-associated Sm-like protein LSm6 n=1 Tax=Lipomyces japonicus TaxID=56871 RepID=UPI0034CF3244